MFVGALFCVKILHNSCTNKGLHINIELDSCTNIGREDIRDKHSGTRSLGARWKPGDRVGPNSRRRLEEGKGE